jgi:hypothetical protein
LVGYVKYALSRDGDLKMKQDKQGKQPPVNYWLICGVIMVMSSWKPSTGSLTRAFNIFCGFGGAALCLVGGIQESKKLKK